MARPEALDAPPSPRRWAAFVGMDNRLVRAVAGAPATVRTKLLVAFLGIARCSSSSACSGCASSARRTPALRGSARSSSERRVPRLAAKATDLRGLLAVRAAGEPGLTG